MQASSPFKFLSVKYTHLYLTRNMVSNSYLRLHSRPKQSNIEANITSISKQPDSPHNTSGTTRVEAGHGQHLHILINTILCIMRSLKGEFAKANASAQNSAVLCLRRPGKITTFQRNTRSGQRAGAESMLAGYMSFGLMKRITGLCGSYTHHLHQHTTPCPSTSAVQML